MHMSSDYSCLLCSGLTKLVHKILVLFIDDDIIYLAIFKVWKKASITTLTQYASTCMATMLQNILEWDYCQHVRMHSRTY